MKLTLCYAPFSCALVPYVTLNEAGAEFEVMTVNFGIGQHHGPEYRRLNPKHKVPMLVIDGEPLSENTAIQIWIARTFQKARLLQAEPKKEIEDISLMAWCASTIQPSLAPNVAPGRFCDLPDAEDSVKKCAYAILAENFAIDHSGRLSRRGSAFQPGMATFNPCGFTHASNPELLPHMFKYPKPVTENQSVMVDTLDPLEVAELPLGCELTN